MNKYEKIYVAFDFLWTWGMLGSALMMAIDIPKNQLAGINLVGNILMIITTLVFYRYIRKHVWDSLERQEAAWKYGKRLEG